MKTLTNIMNFLLSGVSIIQPPRRPQSKNKVQPLNESRGSYVPPSNVQPPPKPQSPQQTTITMNWIPVTERLPNEEESKRKCIICTSDGYIAQTQFNNGKFRSYQDPIGENVIIAWMPLPEPYSNNAKD